MQARVPSRRKIKKPIVSEAKREDFPKRSESGRDRRVPSRMLSEAKRADSPSEARTREKRMLSRALVILGPLAVSACALVANLGDRTLGDPDASLRKSDGSSSGDGDPNQSDGESSDATTDAAARPTFCDGIILYASFDTKLTGDRGGDQTVNLGNVSKTAEGKFNGGLSLVRDSNPDASAALYFVASAAGNPWPEKTGSLSVWFRDVPGNPNTPILYRPVATLPPAPLQTGGLSVYLEVAGKFGLHERTQDPLLTFDVSQLTPYLRAKEYNHYFTAWTQTSKPTAFFALNGGLGVAFSDAGNPNYPDAADVAGDLRVPYRAFTSRSWTVEGPAIGVRLGGPTVNAPDGTFDDLAIWNRVLSFTEAADVYNAGKSIGEVCKL